MLIGSHRKGQDDAPRGEKRMLVWNDLEADEKVKVYDKGVDVTNREGVYDFWSTIDLAICGLLSWSRVRPYVRNCLLRGVYFKWAKPD